MCVCVRVCVVEPGLTAHVLWSWTPVSRAVAQGRGVTITVMPILASSPRALHLPGGVGCVCVCVGVCMLWCVCLVPRWGTYPPVVS